MTKDINKWRREADRQLGAPVVRIRAISTVAGKVEDRFEQVMAARQKGMPWRTIADALTGDVELKEESVESAFRRLCSERGLIPPGRRQARKNETGMAFSSHDRPVRGTASSPTPQGQLFGEQDRWVDDGDD